MSTTDNYVVLLLLPLGPLAHPEHDCLLAHHTEPLHLHPLLHHRELLSVSLQYLQLFLPSLSMPCRELRLQDSVKIVVVVVPCSSLTKSRSVFLCRDLVKIVVVVIVPYSSLTRSGSVFLCRDLVKIFVVVDCL